jgi:hypothetical protein
VRSIPAVYVAATEVCGLFSARGSLLNEASLRHRASLRRGLARAVPAGTGVKRVISAGTWRHVMVLPAPLAASRSGLDPDPIGVEAAGAINLNET